MSISIGSHNHLVVICTHQKKGDVLESDGKHYEPQSLNDLILFPALCANSAVAQSSVKE